MITFIVCSIDPVRLQRLEENIKATVGVPYEFIGFDNRTAGLGICKVYNQCAEQAKYPVLCFLHEDVKLLTDNWGDKLLSQVLKPECGIVGFAGSAVKSRELSGVMHKYYSECNVIDISEGEEPRMPHKQVTHCGLEFAPVITVDGLFQMMRREVWDEIRYDEQTFRGFHLYDLDMALAVSFKYTNYVCHSVNIIHYSRGSYKREWYLESLRYNEKWGDCLPHYINRPSESQIDRDEKYIFFNITYHLLKQQTLPPDEIYPRIKQTLGRYPLKFRGYYLFYRYLRYKFQYKNKS